MRYNVKLFWNYMLYILMSGLGLTLAFMFTGWDVSTIRSLKDNYISIWGIVSLLIFIYFVVSIKNETEWKKMSLLDYLMSLAFAMVQASFFLLALLPITNTLSSTIPGGIELAIGISFFFVITFIFGILFIAFTSALWFKSTGTNTEESSSISFALKRSFINFFKGWTQLTNIRIKEEKNDFTFNLLITTRQAYIIKVLSINEMEKIELGGKEVSVDEKGKKSTKTTKPGEMIINFNKTTQQVKKYLDNFYKDEQNPEAKLNLTQIIVYPFDKLQKPHITGDVEDKLVVSEKEFNKQINDMEFRLEKNIIKLY